MDCLLFFSPPPAHTHTQPTHSLSLCLACYLDDGGGGGDDDDQDDDDDDVWSVEEEGGRKEEGKIDCGVKLKIPSKAEEVSFINPCCLLAKRKFPKLLRYQKPYLYEPCKGEKSRHDNFVKPSPGMKKRKKPGVYNGPTKEEEELAAPFIKVLISFLENGFVWKGNECVRCASPPRCVMGRKGRQ